MPKIEKLSGREILDSRGKPTVLATCVLDGGAWASASVPSGASTGTAEAFELRDGDPKRYRGLGCRQAAANVGGVLHDALAGRVFVDQSELDRAMIALDGLQPNRASAPMPSSQCRSPSREPALYIDKFRSIVISRTCLAPPLPRCLV